jgi:predicted histidine transporter YuiF (NhaC family)
MKENGMKKKSEEVRKSGIRYLFEKEITKIQKEERRNEDNQRKAIDCVTVGYSLIMDDKMIELSLLTFIVSYLMKMIERKEEEEEESDMTMKMRASHAFVILTLNDGFIPFSFIISFFFDFIYLLLFV